MEPVALGGFPFDSQITGYQPDGLPIYDRASNSEEFASLIKGFWRDGVFGTDALTVLAGSGMTATVGTGSVLVQGRVAKIASPKTVNFETANSQPRFDIVVARRDLSNAVRDVVLDVVKGVPASTPVAPSPVRNATIWELCLAIVKIPANVGMVQQQNITDTRLDKNLCGIVAATMTDIDTSRFYEQIQADLSSFREEEQAQFDSWFDSLRDILDENAAGNLYNKIESLTAADVGALPTNGTAADSEKLGGKLPNEFMAASDPRIQMELVWKNANTGSQFDAQDVMMNLSGADFVYMLLRGQNTGSGYTGIIMRVGYRAVPVMTVGTAVVSRMIDVFTDRLTFAAGRVFNFGSTEGADNNLRMIPVEVYKINGAVTE